MTAISKAMVAAYFRKPPAGDAIIVDDVWSDSEQRFVRGRLVGKIGEHDRTVLACNILHSPTYPSIKAAMEMMAAERKKDGRVEAARVWRHTQQAAIDFCDSHLDPALHPWAFHQVPEPIRPVPGRQPETPPRRNAKRLTAADLRGDPILALTRDQREAKVNVYRFAAKILCQESDWDEHLRIAGPKIIDGLLYMSERLVYGVETKLKETAEKLVALQRQTMNDEIPIQQLERLERQMAGYRVQQRHFQMMFFAFQMERDGVVEASGLDWSAYEGIKQRSDRSARAWRERTRRRTSVASVIENMSEAEYRRWVDSQRYTPKHDGVSSADEDVIDTQPDYEGDEGYGE